MFFPYVKDIASKDIVSIDINQTIGQAIQLMIKTDHRAIVVNDRHFHHIILAQDILMANHSELDLNKSLKDSCIHRLPKIHKDKNILEAIHFLQEPVEYILAVDDDNQVFGLLSHADLMNSTDPEILMENYSIGDVIKSQKHDIWVSPTDITKDVIAQMKRHYKDCATVIDNGEPVGIFTVKDVLTIYKDHRCSDVPISEVMTKPVLSVKSDVPIKNAIEFIKSQPFKRLVVVNRENRMIGMSMQKDLISLAYSHWASLMKKHQQELLELNDLLNEKADRYKQLAAIDPLTNLYNRYKFIELFTTEVHSMKQRQQAVSLLLLDIDHFKQVNDTYGHNMGDEILVAISKQLTAIVRNIDVVSRWGGEEFLVMLPTADLEQARIIAEKIRTLIEKTEFPEDLSVTMSIGIHQIDLDDGLEETISKADTALYRAKNNGRNRVESYIEEARLTKNR